MDKYILLGFSIICFGVGVFAGIAYESIHNQEMEAGWNLIDKKSKEYITQTNQATSVLVKYRERSERFLNELNEQRKELDRQKDISLSLTKVVVGLRYARDKQAEFILREKQITKTQKELIDSLQRRLAVIPKSSTYTVKVSRTILPHTHWPTGHYDYSPPENGLYAVYCVRSATDRTYVYAKPDSIYSGGETIVPSKTLK